MLIILPVSKSTFQKILFIINVFSNKYDDELQLIQLDEIVPLLEIDKLETSRGKV